MTPDVEDILGGLIGRVGRVRRWLVALGVLKTAAIGLACVSAYVGLYAWIDHHAHFGHFGRLSALSILLALLTVLGWLLARSLRRRMTYAYAANHVENRRSFDQQLVAAVEYFERRDDYPYSRALAEQLVVQVDEATRDFPFDSTVDKRRGYVLAALIVLGMSVVGVFIQQNVLYFSSYLSRLVRPLAQIEPVPAMILSSLTADILTPPDDPVTLTAQVEGRTPESVTLVLTRREPNEPNEVTERIEVPATVDPNGRTTFTTTQSFDSTGDRSYHFEARGASSEAYQIKVREPPAIKGITARITPPAGQKGPGVAPYTEQVEGGALEVLPGSRVELQVACNTPLREAAVARAGREPRVQPMNGADTFPFDLQADTDAALDFKLTSTDGLINRQPQQLRVAIKADAPPEFKLLSPEGDYLATDVASIPIAFEITDDVGLDSVQLYCELPGRSPMPLASQVVHGAKSAALSHTLELEQYELKVGDSILFYAGATDIETGQVAADTGHCSDVYFIEIRPYQQFWHPQAANDKPSSMLGVAAEDLITILEYTRAILKKVWTLAHDSPPGSEAAASFDGLGRDLDYCEQRLAALRDDPDNKFSEADKAALRRVGEQYTQTGERLGRRDASGALPPAREAYRLLRQFIDERNLQWSPPQSGQSIPQDKPERVKLQEEPRSPEADQQRLENQLEKLQQKIESLAREQKSLSSRLSKALQQDQADAAEQLSSGSSSGPEESGQASSQQGQSSGGSGSSAQKAQDGSTAEAKPQGRNARQDAETQEARDTQAKATSTPDQADSGQQSTGDSPTSASGNTGSQDGKQSTGSPGTSPGGSDATTAGKSLASGNAGKSSTPGKAGTQSDKASSSGQASSPGGSKSSDSHQGRASGSPQGSPEGSATDAMLRMLEAKQKALREAASQAQADLGRLSPQPASATGQAKEQAQQHLGQAVKDMEDFEDQLGDSRYESAMSPEDKQAIAALATAAGRQLSEAGRAIKQGLSAGKPPSAAEQAQEMAEQLAEDAEALDESLSPAERQRMLERLEAAKRLLEKQANPQWGAVSGRGQASGALVYTGGGPLSPAEIARMMAQQFWSIAIEARRRETQPVAQPPSDAEFFEAEKEFFEEAARYGTGE